MTALVRLQLSRRKGFNLQALSRDTNGNEAVNVARPSRWGNPAVVGKAFEGEDVDDARHAISIFTDGVMHDMEGFPPRGDIRNRLRGKNLACWCELGEPCHADVLLEIANR